MARVTRISNHSDPVRADGKPPAAEDFRDVAAALRRIGKHSAAAHYDAKAAAMEKKS